MDQWRALLTMQMRVTVMKGVEIPLDCHAECAEAIGVRLFFCHVGIWLQPRAIQLCWTKWHRDGHFSENFGFSVSYHSTNAPFLCITGGYTVGTLVSTVPQSQCVFPPEQKQKVTARSTVTAGVTSLAHIGHLSCYAVFWNSLYLFNIHTSSHHYTNNKLLLRRLSKIAKSDY
jgi:hypothetical protein